MYEISRCFIYRWDGIKQWIVKNKEILIDYNPLLLSSLGAIIYENKKEIILQKNISILYLCSLIEKLRFGVGRSIQNKYGKNLWKIRKRIVIKQIPN